VDERLDTVAVIGLGGFVVAPGLAIGIKKFFVGHRLAIFCKWKREPLAKYATLCWFDNPGQPVSTHDFSSGRNIALGLRSIVCVRQTIRQGAVGSFVDSSTAI